MSAKSVVYAALTSTGIPGRQDAYPVGKAPVPPFFVYTVESEGGFVADGTVYAALPRFHVELFEKVSNPETEKSVRDAILSLGCVPDETGIWSESEVCHIQQFDFTYHNREE
jgi:hypothetical protein